MQPMSITAGGLHVMSRHLEDGQIVLRPEGELDVFTAPVMKRALTEGIEAGSRDLIIDLGGVAYLDSSGLSTLMWASRRATITLVTSNPRIQRVMRITGLEKVIRMVSTLAEATTQARRVGSSRQA